MEKAIYAISPFSPTQDIRSANQCLCTSYKTNKLKTNPTAPKNSIKGRRKEKGAGVKESSGNAWFYRKKFLQKPKRYIMKYLEFYQ